MLQRVVTNAPDVLVFSFFLDLEFKSSGKNQLEPKKRAWEAANFVRGHSDAMVAITIKQSESDCAVKIAKSIFLKVS